MKKIILALLALLVIAGGAFFFLNAQDTYDKSKYNVSITPNDKRIAVGSTLEFTLPDQFDKAHTLSDSSKILILTFAKKSAHDVRNFLKIQVDNYLTKNNAFYVADISPMPVIIRNAFAMPDLKKSAYPVILIYDQTFSAVLKDETKAAEIMLVRLENKKVTAIKFVQNIADLEKELH